MARITWHTQNLGSVSGWLPALVEQSGTKYIKVIDPPEQNPFPTARVIGRTYMPDADSNAMIWNGAAGAEQWFQHWEGFYASRGYVWAWVAPNEPQPMWDGYFVSSLNAFTLCLSELMQNAGLRLVGMNWSVGWPYLSYFDDPAPRVVALGPAIQDLAERGHYLGLHEYGAPEMWSDPSGAHTLRYRHMVAELESYGFSVPPIIIGECGIDGGVLDPPQWKTGWKTHATDWDSYFNQLIWYDWELQQDNVAAATIFITGAEQEWMDFEVGEAESVDLAWYILQDEEPPPPPPPIERMKTFYLSYNQDQTTKAHIQAAKDAGFGAVHIRAGGGLTPDRLFEQFVGWVEEVGLPWSAWWYVRQEFDGQAAEFRRVIGSRRPYAIHGDVEHHDLTVEKADGFFKACDRNFADIGLTCDVYTAAWWLNPRPTPTWEAEGRRLWVANYIDEYPPPDDAQPYLPDAYTTWTDWQSKCAIVPPFIEPICVDVYNGTLEDFMEEYGLEPEEEYPYSVAYTMYDGSNVSREIYEGVFGPFLTLHNENGLYYIRRLKAIAGNQNLRVRAVEIVDGKWVGVTNVRIAVCWPGGQDIITTGADGWASHTMGDESWYNPDDGRGPYWVYVLSEDGGSCTLDGAGWLFQTQYNHFDVVLMQKETPPPPDIKEQIRANLVEMIATGLETLDLVDELP